MCGLWLLHALGSAAGADCKGPNLKGGTVVPACVVRPQGTRPHYRRWCGSRNETLWKVSLRVRSVRLDAGELNHLAPLLRFVGYELSKVGRRAWKRGGAQVGKPRLHLGIGEGRIDLFVELV